MDTEGKKSELVILLAHQRDLIDQTGSRLKHELNVPQRLKQSVQRNPLAWFAGALGTTAAVTFFLRRPKVVVKDHKRHGMLFSVAKLAFSAARPAITAWAVAKGKEELEKHLSQPD